MRHNHPVRPARHHGHQRTLPLSSIQPGELATVVQVDGGHGFVGRMVALGFTPGSQVDVVRNPGSGPIIVRVLDTQIALGQGQASKVMVRCLHSRE